MTDPRKLVSLLWSKLFNMTHELDLAMYVRMHISVDDCVSTIKCLHATATFAVVDVPLELETLELEMYLRYHEEFLNRINSTLYCFESRLTLLCD